jgi:hypothetical protein
MAAQEYENVSEFYSGFRSVDTVGPIGGNPLIFLRLKADCYVHHLCRL